MIYIDEKSMIYIDKKSMIFIDEKSMNFIDENHRFFIDEKEKWGNKIDVLFFGSCLGTHVNTYVSFRYMTFIL